MFLDFFIALFGGLYYGGKALSESNNKKVREANHERQKALITVVRSKAEENKLKQQFSTDKGRKSILSSIEDDVKHVFGDKCDSLYSDYQYSEENSIHTCDIQGFGDVWNIAFVIYLSKLGYINSLEYAYLKPINGVKKSTKPGKYYEFFTEDTEWSHKVCSRVCEVVEKNIQEKRGMVYSLQSSIAPAHIKQTMRWHFGEK